jgi:hypothetical protein
MDSMYADDAMRAMLAASSRLCKLFPKPLKVLEDIRPYADCPVMLFRNPIKPERIDIVTAQVRSLLYGLVADCYRIAKQYDAAAVWYQLASTFYMGGGYPAFYARMVIKHSIRIHYRKAYECISFSNRIPRQVSWFKQIMIYVSCFAKTPIWHHISVLQVCFLTRHYERELARRIQGEQLYVFVSPRLLP